MSGSLFGRQVEPVIRLSTESVDKFVDYLGQTVSKPHSYKVTVKLAKK